MPPVVESSTTYNATSVSTIVNTKPTGLAIGDYMVHYCWYIDGTNNTYTTPAGWTKQIDIDSFSAARKLAVFTKVADSGDVAAANFTVTVSATCDAVCGVLLRISNVGAFNVASSQANNPVSATMSFTSSVTPAVANTLVLLGLAYRSGAGLTTVSSYTSTPSLTFTEVQDTVTDFGAEDPGIAIARATTSDTSTITAYGATISAAKDYHVGTIILLTPAVNTTGTNAVFEILPTFFNQNGRADTRGTNALLEVSPTINTQNGRATAPTQWQNEDKPSTTWINDPL